jgi:hypothetical protein
VKKHGLKIMIGAYIVVYAATIWLCGSTMGRVRKLSNAVKTQAQVVKQHLSDPTPVAEMQNPFNSGDVLNRIRSRWSRAPEVPERAFPSNVLQAGPESPE